MDTFAERLAYAMRRVGKTAAELARESGVKPPSIARYMSGERAGKAGISAEIAKRLARPLGVTSSWLGTGEDPMLADGTPGPKATRAATVGELAALYPRRWPSHVVDSAKLLESKSSLSAEMLLDRIAELSSSGQAEHPRDTRPRAEVAEAATQALQSVADERAGKAPSVDRPPSGHFRAPKR